MTDSQMAASFLRTILDANPSVVLIVDKDVRIMAFNLAAEKLIGNNTIGTLKNRTGGVIHCLNATKTPNGCGHSQECSSCIIRTSVSQAMAGQTTYRVRTRMTLASHGTNQNYFFLITASPFEYEGELLVHLVLEDITEFMEMRALIPICAQCKKIRQDDDYWDAVETFMSKYLDLSFSHGYCPECAEALLKQIKSRSDKKQPNKSAETDGLKPAP